MKKAVFDFIWEKCIDFFCKQVFADLKSRMPDDKYKIKLDETMAFKDKVYKTYQEYRDMFHNEYFNNANGSLIDRHKISACIIVALIKNRPISYLLDDTLPTGVFLSNYKVAFLAGVKCLYVLRIAQWSHDKQDKEMILKLCEQQMFKFPKTHEGHDEYSIGRIKALALNDILERDFDILAYADMLYWIERFNDENISRFLEQSDN